MLGVLFFRAEGLSCSLDVLLRRPRDQQFLIKKMFKKISQLYRTFFPIFVHRNPWIRIPISILPKMLDPDPESMNPDPKHCPSLCYTQQESPSAGGLLYIFVAVYCMLIFSLFFFSGKPTAFGRLIGPSVYVIPPLLCNELYVLHPVG